VAGKSFVPIALGRQSKQTPF
nr:RecName: Full=44 kDa cell wall protein 2 [Solanum lycopersicum]